MVGANIGGGEWLFGPIVTARYGGTLMWIATLSISFQVFYNLAVMRYTLYTGEPIFVGFLRTSPGPKFWFVFYLMADLGYIWPFLASNAAVPLAAAVLGRLPTPEDDPLVRTLGYVIFLAAFVPLVFGGKVYNMVERVMTAKVVLVFGYLVVVDLFMVSGDVWYEVFSGFLRFGSLPDQEVDWATLAAFAAVAGAGGLSNTLFSNYVRDKGWGMGAAVGAIPSLVGSRRISLLHVGKVFALQPGQLLRWRGWLRHVYRDQIVIWGGGCLLGMALPALLSLQFIPGVQVDGHAAAALTADGIASRHGVVFWHLTLLCGFVVLGPGVVQTIDGICRRWTDVVWSASRRLRQNDPRDVKRVYYTILLAYGVWGMIALKLTPDPLTLAVVSTTLGNVGFAVSTLHALYVNRRLLPRQLRPHWTFQLGLVGAFVFFFGISAIAVRQRWMEWLTTG